MADWALTNTSRHVEATLGELSEERNWSLVGDQQGLYVPAEYPEPFRVWPTYPALPSNRRCNAMCNLCISAGWILAMNGFAKADPATDGTATAEASCAFTVSVPVSVTINACLWIYNGLIELSGPSNSFSITEGYTINRNVLLDAGDYVATLRLESNAETPRHANGSNAGILSIGPV